MSALDFASIGSTIGRGLMGGQDAYGQGYSKMAQVMADTGAKQAQANLYNTKAENERQRAAYQSPEAMLPGLAAAAGLTVPQFKEFQERHNTGSWGMNPASEDPARQVSIAPTPKSAPDWATPEMQQRARDVIANMYNTFGATGDTNAEQIAKGFKTLTETNRANNAFGSGGAQALNAIMAAEGGKLYSSTPRGILTQETGAENVNPLWAESERAQAQQRRAAAAENYAGAGLKKAQTEKTKAEISEFGKAPPGYRWLPNGDLEAIPGGHADAKRADAAQADIKALSAAEYSMSRLASDAEAPLNNPGLNRITGVMGAIPNIPGSSASNAEAQLDVLKSQIAFSTLQAMREASKTGGALGSVSEKELKLLENNIAALDQAQSYEAMRDSLKKIIDFTGASKQRMRNAVGEGQGGNQPVPQQQTPRPDRTQLLSEAKQAIANGAPRDAVIKRLKELGVNEGGF